MKLFVVHFTYSLFIRILYATTINDENLLRINKI
jgi:hypothetical protein